MSPRVTYTIAGSGSAIVSAGVTWLVGPEVPGAPFVSAAFGALFGAWVIGNALRGSYVYMREERTPLSPRGRWIYGGIGAAIVIGFPLLLSIVYEPR